MRPQDKTVFLMAAKQLRLWILVRRTNVASLPYIGQPNYVPKPLDCKAKTADRNVGGFRVAGLVVDPSIHPQAFNAAKLPEALKIWHNDGQEMIRSGRYTVDGTANSPHYGCIQLQGKYVHGDYDLYDIIDPEQAQRNLSSVDTLLGKPHRRGAKFYTVQEFVNHRIGCAMVQHGGEMQYADHSEQAIDAFGPDGEDVTILNKFSVQRWYADRFQGRQALGRKPD